MELENKIEVTVALPTWENKNIIWLQLESLCNQQTKYKWELIVCEEQTKNMSGEELILSYKERLEKVGCVNINYIPLNEHIPLSKKWWVIANEAKGETFLLCASDNYSPPNRIELSHEKLKDEYQWFDVAEGLFFNLNTHDVGTFRNQPNQTGLFMGTKTSIIKKLKGPWPPKYIDNWIRSQMNIQPRYRHEKPLLGLHTDGANKISKSRNSLYSKGKYGTHFQKPTQNKNDFLSEEIITKLDNFRGSD